MKMFKFLLVYKNKQRAFYLIHNPLRYCPHLSIISLIQEKKQTPALCNMMDDSREQNEASTLMELQSGRRHNHQEDN